MASELPATREELGRLEGVGARKLDDFGDDFLTVIAEYARQSGTGGQAARPGLTARPSSSARLSASVCTSLELFREGHDPEAIAALRGLVRSTVEGHLATAMEAGEHVDLGRLVPGHKRRAIERAIEKVGRAALTPILEELGDGYTYADCRFVRAALAWGKPLAEAVSS